jgi:hypothetical protein
MLTYLIEILDFFRMLSELRYEKIHGKQRPSLILLIPLGINSGKTTVVAVGALELQNLCVIFLHS